MWWRIHDCLSGTQTIPTFSGSIREGKGVWQSENLIVAAPDSGSRIVLFDPKNFTGGVIDSFDQYVLDPGKLQTRQACELENYWRSTMWSQTNEKKWKTPVICQSATTSTAFLAPSMVRDVNGRVTNLKPLNKKFQNAVAPFLRHEQEGWFLEYDKDKKGNPKVKDLDPQDTVYLKARCTADEAELNPSDPQIITGIYVANREGCGSGATRIGM